ncbi:MAG: PCMD domain-containing protein, partial [Muribaculaceae bacterium]|nr:PCMD domain-containing protein [Muribaculaceae bacterium]
MVPSCIKDEMPNMEVDILEVSAPSGNILSVVIHSDIIDVYVAPEVDKTELELSFLLSEGATISPDPETIVGYESPQSFTVTSEDGNWTKDYMVNVRHNSLPLKYDFENWMQPERMRYLIPYEKTESGERMLIWSCGNEAFNFLTGKNDDYTVFPTLPTDDAFGGNQAAMLVTRLTGQLDRPIAAGNLFIGQFDSSLREPRESTMFGLPFNNIPLTICGKYRYRSGGSTILSGERDGCRIQAVLYRTDQGEKHLNGFTIRTSPSIVARAEMTTTDDTPGEQYADFNLDFVYEADVDHDAMARGCYNLAVIFTSSRNGDI